MKNTRSGIPGAAWRFGLAVALAVATAQAAEPPHGAALYKDANAPIDARIDDLLSRLTLEEKIAQITAIINRISEIQNTVAAAVEEQSATTSEIVRNVNEAAQGTSGITQKIAAMTKATESTTGGSRDTQSAADGLARLAMELRDLVQQFRI